MADPVPSPGHARTADESHSDALQAELAAVRARLLIATKENDKLREVLEEADVRERVLTYELQHRSRNLLSVIRSVYRLSRESGASQDEFAEHFDGRLDVIARYHSDLVGPGSSGVELKDVIRDELQRVHCVDGPNLVISGPVVSLRQKALELFSLAVHELTTNAIKFGALYHEGVLTIDWTVTSSPDQQILHFSWSETSVPLIAAAPRARGFGRQVIEEALPYQLDATTVFEFGPGGVTCSITLPLRPLLGLEAPVVFSAGSETPTSLANLE